MACQDRWAFFTLAGLRPSQEILRPRHAHLDIDAGLPEQDQQLVFVFNKTWFKPGARLGRADAPVVHARLPTKEQSLSSSCSAHAVVNDLQSRAEQDGLEPMHRLMFDFLKGLLHSTSQGEAYEAACKQRLQICEQLQAEVGLQRRASDLALTSLLRYYETVARIVDRLENEIGQIKELVAKTISHSKVVLAHD